jgi:hypothetical protein
MCNSITLSRHVMIAHSWHCRSEIRQKDRI